MVYPPPARMVLRMNAVVSLVGGFAILLTTSTLSSLTGIEESILAAVGVGVMIFGAGSAIVSASRGINRKRVLPFALADLGWVAGSLALLVFAPHEMTAIGRALVGASATIVSWFAMAELRASRTL